MLYAQTVDLIIVYEDGHGIGQKKHELIFKVDK